jgi:hypothetical protein
VFAGSLPYVFACFWAGVSQLCIQCGIFILSTSKLITLVLNVIKRIKCSCIKAANQAIVCIITWQWIKLCGHLPAACFCISCCIGKDYSTAIEIGNTINSIRVLSQELTDINIV